MTFKEVLRQVVKWLQEDGRVSNRALKRQFDVGDDYLEDVKEVLQTDKEILSRGFPVSTDLNPPHQVCGTMARY